MTQHYHNYVIKRFSCLITTWFQALQKQSKCFWKMSGISCHPILLFMNENFFMEEWVEISSQKFVLIGLSNVLKSTWQIKAYKESLVDSVIQATGTVEFEDGLRTGVHLGGCWCPWGGCTDPRINFKPLLEVWVGPGLGEVVRRVPFQTKFQSAWFRPSVVSNYSCYVVLGLNRPRR